MAKGLYRGFSFFEYESSKKFQVTDFECVKMDLLNHIFTRKGERVMMPSFGTIIQDLTFEPLDDDVLETLREEVEYVIDYDPRVSLINLELNPSYDTNTVTVAARLFYVELNTVDDMYLNIEFAN